MHKVLHYLCPGTKNFQKVKEVHIIISISNIFTHWLNGSAY